MTHRHKLALTTVVALTCTSMKYRPSRFVAFGFMVCFALTGWTSAAAAAACTLTAADLTALQLSNAHLADRAQIDALSQDRGAMLCRTRLQWNRVASGQWAESDLIGVSVYYLSPAERLAFSKIQTAVIEARLKHMSDAEWRQFQQKLLDESKK